MSALAKASQAPQAPQASVPLVEVRDLARRFDVSAPWLNLSLIHI